MKSIRTWWLPLLLGASLMAVLICAAAAAPGARPLAAAATKKLTISTADFSPVYDSSYIASPHEKYGDYLRSRINGGSNEFVAAVHFPYDGVVTVEKLQLMAYDANSSARVILALYRSNPSKVPSRKELARIDTGVLWSGGYHIWNEPNISPRYVTTGQELWLWLVPDDDTDLFVYGVTIYYHKGK